MFLFLFSCHRSNSISIGQFDFEASLDPKSEGMPEDRFVRDSNHPRELPSKALKEPNKDMLQSMLKKYMTWHASVLSCVRATRLRSSKSVAAVLLLPKRCLAKH